MAASAEPGASLFHIPKMLQEQWAVRSFARSEVAALKTHGQPVGYQGTSLYCTVPLNMHHCC